MATNFTISMDRDDRRLMLKLAGDFDDSSATELVEVLKHNRHGVRIATIETSGLNRLDPRAKRTFQRAISALEDFCYCLVFTGRNAGELAPCWTGYF